MNWEVVCFVILTVIDTLELAYIVMLSVRLSNERLDRQIEIAKLNSVIAATQSATERKCGKTTTKKTTKKGGKKATNVKGVY